MKINEKFDVRRDSLFILRKLMSIEMKKKNNLDRKTAGNTQQKTIKTFFVFSHHHR